MRTRLEAICRYGLGGHRQRDLLDMAMPYWQGRDSFIACDRLGLPAVQPLG